MREKCDRLHTQESFFEILESNLKSYLQILVRKSHLKLTKMCVRSPIGVAKVSRNLTNNQASNAIVESNNYDSVSVFCRIRPLQSKADLSCLRLKNSTTVILTSPEQAVQHKQQDSHRETQYIFKHIFCPYASQHEVFSTVAQPLVENLLCGKNSLLFTYGVTGSGKTYTMTGDGLHRGIMPRCLDVLFRTISDLQAKKFIFKPDRLNGFEIVSEEDALLERQAEMHKRFTGCCRGGLRRKDSDSEMASQASNDMPPLKGVDEDNVFAVFVTYVEIYNNCVYDLLEDNDAQRSLQSKIIREDAKHNMFVHGVTELEIKTMEEAIEAFQTGRRRKRMGHTALNSESSRSHSVFNIRLVQAPSDSQGENVMQDKRTITVSQLSLVDLAGSERSSRTKNTGLRLREAGNINNSLMTLRTCLEYLRENQQVSSGVPPKKIPYRDAKLTHLFKNFFDGEGKISMVVCVNPRIEDYDENAQVLKFAEMSQEVKIARGIAIKPDCGLTPGRRKANKLFKVAVNNLKDMGFSEAKKLEVDLGLVYSMGPDLPDFDINKLEVQEKMNDLMKCLLQRIEKRKVLRTNMDNKCNSFRLCLLGLERDNLSLRAELASIKAAYEQDRQRIYTLESKIRVHENSIDNLNNKVSNRERQIDELSFALNRQENLLAKKDQEKEKQKKKFSSKLAIEVNKKDQELEIKLRQQRAKLQERMRIKDEKLRLVSNIIRTDNVNRLVRSVSSENFMEDNCPHTGEQTTQTEVYSNTTHAPHGVTVANPRHRRSRSMGEKWIEHRAPNPVPLGTILQPYIKSRKSVTKLIDMKDLTGHKATKYCLVSQEADTDGDVETKLYKGSVIPTCGGGAQVVFDDVECLKQKSPIEIPTRKRPNAKNFSAVSGIGSASAISADTPSTHASLTKILGRCNIGIEGHSNKRSKI